MKGIYDPEDSYFRPLSFEEQFADVRRYGGGRETVEYVDLRPENWSEERPIVFVGSGSASLRSLGDLGQTLYERQRRVLLVDFTESNRSRYPKEKLCSDEWIYAETVNKSNLLIGVLIEAQIKKADVIAHSEGVLTAAVAAEYYGHFFDKLVLAMPAGMIGTDSISELLRRFMPKITRGLREDMRDNPKTGLAVNLGATSHAVKKPMKTYQEASGIAKTTIDKTLNSLRNQELKVGILQAYEDPVFLQNRIRKNVRLEGPYANVDAYASLRAKNAGHDDLLINPKRSVTAALQMLDSL